MQIYYNIKMSKRAGQIETMTDLINEVGVDAARFFFLLRGSDSHLDFDLEVAKHQTNDNPVFYVQYAHARVCSIFQQAAQKNIPIPLAKDVDLSSANNPLSASILLSNGNVLDDNFRDKCFHFHSNCSADCHVGNPEI